MSDDPQNIITILIADDHPMALEGVRSILQKTPDIKIVGEAQDGSEIKPLIKELHPRILLLDLRMPNLFPVELQKWIRENHPETVTLAFTAHHHVAYLASMMEAGVAGYLDKRLQGNDLAASIRRAARGEILYDEEQIEQAQQWREEVSMKLQSLSDREKEVLQQIALGEDNKSIAAFLAISPKTVEFHIANIRKKLALKSRDEIIVWMLKHQLDDLDE